MDMKLRNGIQKKKKRKSKHRGSSDHRKDTFDLWRKPWRPICWMKSLEKRNWKGKKRGKKNNFQYDIPTRCVSFVKINRLKRAKFGLEYLEIRGKAPGLWGRSTSRFGKGWSGRLSTFGITSHPEPIPNLFLSAGGILPAGVFTLIALTTGFGSFEKASGARGSSGFFFFYSQEQFPQDIKLPSLRAEISRRCFHR